MKNDISVTNINPNELLEKANKGLRTLDIDEKHIIAALEALKVWLTDDGFQDYVPQLMYLIEAKKWDFL